MASALKIQAQIDINSRKRLESPMLNTDKPLTAKQFAKELGVKTNTVYEWIRDGRLPAWKTPGNQWRIDASGLAFVKRMWAAAGQRRLIREVAANPDTARAWFGEKKALAKARGEHGE